MRRFFEMLGILLFLLLVLGEVTSSPWSKRFRWSFLVLGALGGVAVLIWRFR